MIIVYDSRTGQGMKFAQKLGYDIQSIDEPIHGDYILVTRNEGFGKVPQTTLDFLEKNHLLAKGVVVNGIKRYGPFYCKAADKIHKLYNIPIAAKIELAGNDEDVKRVQDFIALL